MIGGNHVNSLCDGYEKKCADLRAQIASLVVERDHFQTEWSKSVREKHEAWAERDKALDENARLRAALGRIQSLAERELAEPAYTETRTLIEICTITEGFTIAREALAPAPESGGETQGKGNA